MSLLGVFPTYNICSYSPIDLRIKSRPIRYTSQKMSNMYEVKMVFGVSRALLITVVCLCSGYTNVHTSRTSSTSKMQFGGTRLGWIGDRSTPRTVVFGYWSAKSIAQIPVPHPTSKTRFEFVFLAADFRCCVGVAHLDVFRQWSKKKLAIQKIQEFLMPLFVSRNALS